MHYIPIQWEAMREWLQTPKGKALLEAEKKAISHTLARVLGYHLLLLGEPAFGYCVEKSPIPTKIIGHPFPVRDYGLSPVATRQDKLAFDNDSLEVVYLAHCLEFMHNPHEILREAYRVLKPEGYLILSGFKICSLWALMAYVGRISKKAPWGARLHSFRKLLDWLALLGFEVEEEIPYAYPFPFKFLPSASIIIAQKEIVPLTPLREPAWVPEVQGFQQIND